MPEQLRLARNVQEALVPPRFADLPGLEIAVRFLPSKRVSGDFLDYFTLGPRYMGFYVGDVQGKGLEAALYALLVSGLMRGLHKTGTDPAYLVATLNRRLCYRPVPGKFCCLSYALFDLQQRQLRLANAGLPFPLLVRDRTVTSIELAGFPIGMFDPSEYEQVAINLEPGDHLLFYTDGLPDSLDALSGIQGAGADQVAEIFSTDSHRSTSELADRLLAPLRSRRTARRPLADDTTFVLLHIL